MFQHTLKNMKCVPYLCQTVDYLFHTAIKNKITKKRNIKKHNKKTPHNQISIICELSSFVGLNVVHNATH